MKIRVQKSALVILGIILALGVSEVLLHLIHMEYVGSYTLNPQYKDKYYKAFSGSRYDEFYDQYSGSMDKSIKIVTVGDSFTNGGNVTRKSNYPSHLYRLFNGKYELTNLGMCEGTSRDALIRINDFYENRKGEGEKVLFLLLVGVSDLFMRDRYFNQENYRDIIKDFEVRNLSSKGLFNMDPTLRTFVLLKEAYFKLSEYFETSKEFNSDLFDEIEVCFKPSTPQSLLRECLRLVYRENKNFNKRGRQIISILNFFSMAKKDLNIVDLIFDLIDESPAVMSNPHIAYNALALSSRQSVYSIEEIYKKLKKVYIKNRGTIENQGDFNELNNYGALFSSLEEVINNEDRLVESRRKNLKEIIQLVKRNGDNIIFLNYPMDYRAVNNDLSHIAKESGVMLIDVLQAFGQSNNRHLIDDWEHATPAGYRIMAETIHKNISAKSSDYLER